MAKEGQSELCIVDDEDRILSWLRNAALDEYGDDADELGDAVTIDSVTPPRRNLLREYFDEISPTNTSFSSGSIFDTPQSPANGCIEDVFGDDIPDKVPIDNCTYRPDEEDDLAWPQAHISIDQFDAESHVSYDPPSEVTEESTDIAEISTAVAIPHIDADKPRPTWLTSCTQCIHADLPCSREAPACSRCGRKGQAALCLLHRRPYPEEILKSDASWSTTLILLRLRDEDEEVWKEKLRLNDKVGLERLVGAWLTRRSCKTCGALGTTSRTGYYHLSIAPEVTFEVITHVSWRRTLARVGVSAKIGSATRSYAW